MTEALRIACENTDEIPVGALLVAESGQIVMSAGNSRKTQRDITGHAEINAIRQTMQLFSKTNLTGLTLFSTLEPCPMCAFATREAKLTRLVFGAFDTKYGSAGSRYDVLRDRRLGPEVSVIGGILEADCSRVLSNFFAKLR
jgi:tRNA(adenine34) deaminase